MRRSMSVKRNLSRVAKMVALSGAIAMAACEDITAPEETATAAPELRLAQSSAADVLGSLSDALDSMTGWSLTTLDGDPRQGSIVGVLNGMKGHLKSGNVGLIQQDVTQARGILSSLTFEQQVETGPVGVALDVVEQAIGGSQ
jgi:hypothetical protein